ncbi:MAG: YlxM family DNA-binding protein [Acidaminococcaceae bacterium]
MLVTMKVFGDNMLVDIGFEQRMRLVRLYDIYGGLLTDKQQKCMELHFYNDLSLSEIADEDGVSRQAIYDLLKRAGQILERYENRLKLLEREKENSDMLIHAEELLTDYIKSHEKNTNLELVQTILRELNGKGRA